MPMQEADDRTRSLSGARARLPWGYAALFFVSGFPALIYEVVWQRALLPVLGSTIESATLVVTAFMLGLGLGGMIGGAISRRQPVPTLAWFAVLELSIGFFGTFSLDLFRRLGLITLDVAPVARGALVAGVLLCPTLLMGATLPLLVSHATRVWRNTGQAVGVLYALNTLGSAVAAVATALVLLGRLGQHRSIWLAVWLNVAVGLAALAFSWGGEEDG